MPPTDRKREIQQIINVFETGHPEGAYGTVTVLADGAGISYGRSQSTDRSDTLDLICERYIAAHGLHAAELATYLLPLRQNATTTLDPANLPAWCVHLMRVLHDAGADPVMQRVQDAVFDERYWTPAVAHAADAGLTLPLSLAVVYDTCIQSGPGAVEHMRSMFPAVAPSKGGDEKTWTAAYVAARRAWLTGPAQRAAVQRTAYRMGAFAELMAEGRWELAAPFSVMGRVVAAPAVA